MRNHFPATLARPIASRDSLAPFCSMASRINLDTTFPIKSSGPAHALPVLVDLNWFGHIMTMANAGIVRFASGSKVPFADSHEVEV